MSQLSDVEQALQDCFKVQSLRNHEGWIVLRQYLERTIETNNRVWLLLPKDDPRLERMREEAARCYAMISLIENFEHERKKLEELWLKLQDESEDIPFDVDNRTPLKEDV